MKSSASVYLSRLDHLRFFAALVVLYWHGSHHNGTYPASTVPRFFAWSLFEEGHTGVALFMTLSGFIFTALCFDRTIVYREFFRNRLLRIAPLFIFWTLFINWFVGVPPERLFAIVVGLLDRHVYSGLGWTVLVEFQFYVIFPFLIRFTKEQGPKYLVGFLFMMILLRSTTYLEDRNVQDLAYWSIFGRIDQFLLGMLAFLVYRKDYRIIGHPVFFLAVLTAWLLIYHKLNVLGGFVGSQASLTLRRAWIVWPTLEGFFYGLIAISYLRLRIWIPLWLDRTLGYLGTLSYSLYLNHMAVLTSCYAIANHYGLKLIGFGAVTWFTFLVILPASVAISSLTYVIIERPFLGLRRSYFVPRSQKASAAES